MSDPVTYAPDQQAMAMAKASLAPQDTNILQKSIQDAGGNPNQSAQPDFAGTAMRNFVIDSANNTDIAAQISDQGQAVGIFQKMLPNVPREQIASQLGDYYKNFTGSDPNPESGMANPLAQILDSSFKDIQSSAQYWHQQQSEGMVKGFGGLLDTLGIKNQGLNAIEAEAQVNASESSKSAQDALQQAGIAAEKAQAYNKEWWYPVASTLAQFGAAGVEMGKEILPATLVAGEVGARFATADAMGTMMAASSYKTMRDRGLDHDQADAAANVIKATTAGIAGLGLAGAVEGALEPIIAKASTAALPAMIAALATGTGAATLDMTAQQAAADLEQNAAYQGNNQKYGSDYASRVATYMNAIDLAQKALGDQITIGYQEYSKSALIPLDNPQKILADLMNTAGTTALGAGLLGMFGIGGAVAVKAVKDWKAAGASGKNIQEKIQTIAEDLKTENAVQTAEPQPEATGNFVKDAQGNDLVVHHAAIPVTDFSKFGTGIAFHEDAARAEADSRLQSEAPLDAQKFTQVLAAKYPGIVADAAEAVMKSGPEGAKPFEDGLKTWAEDNPGTNPNDILILADSIHSGEPVPDRNELVARYGLDSALPAGGIVSAKIQADKIAHVDYQSQVADAFKAGAQAVEHDGTWYVKDAKHVVVTGKTESQAEAMARGTHKPSPAQEPIEPGPKLSSPERYQGAADEYNKIKDSHGGRTLNVDLARELIPEYRADRSKSEKFQKEASAFIKKRYSDLLKEPVPEGKSPTVLFMAGGSGAGKTSAVGKTLAKVREKADIVYDGTMKDFESSREKIEQAVESGRDVTVSYVYRHPVDAYVNGVLPRAMKEGRPVSADFHAESHSEVPKTIQKLMDVYKDDPNVKFVSIDNTGGPDDARVVPHSEIPSPDLSKLKEEVHYGLDKEYQAGRISDPIYRASKARVGEAPGSNPEGVGGDRSNAGGESEAVGQGERGGTTLQESLDARYDELHSPEQGTFDFGGADDSNRPRGDLPAQGVDPSRNDFWAFKHVGDSKTVDVIGKRVPGLKSFDGRLNPKGAEGLYNVMKIYRDRRYETFRFVFLDDQGNIKDHLAVSAEHPTRAPISPSYLGINEHLEMVRKMAEDTDTKAVMVHNHPSGDVTPSIQDEQVTHKVWQALGDRYGGHIILNHGEFASSHGVSIAKRDKVSFGKFKLPSADEADPTVNSANVPGWAGSRATPESVKDLASYVDKDKNYVPIFLANSSNARINALHYVPRSIWEGGGESLSRHLNEAHTNTGTSWAFPVVDTPADMARAEELHASRMVMDYVYSKNGTPETTGRTGGSATDLRNPGEEAKFVQAPEQDYVERDKFLADQETRLTQNEKALDDYEKAAPKLLEKLSKGKTFEQRDEINKQIKHTIETLRKANTDDRTNLETLKASPGPTRDQAEHDAIKESVAKGEVVPDGYLIKYAGEDWADAEIHHREDLRDQVDHARAFDNLEDYLASIEEDRALANSPDPFESDLSEAEFAAAEKKARDEAVLTPDEHERWTQVYGIAHAKTPEELDAQFKASLTPEKVKSLLAGMNQEGYVADKGLPRHVMAQVAKSREGGKVNEFEISRIQKTMENDPRTYRRIDQQLKGDLSELASLAIEDRVGKAVRTSEEFPPEVKRIELPTEMNIEDKAAIRLGTKSRAEWQRKAMDASAQVSELSKKIDELEKSVAEVRAQRDAAKAKATAERRDLKDQAAVERDDAYERTMANLETAIKRTREEMKAKEAEKKAFRQVRDQMRAMGEYIAKPAPKTIHVSEARQIENMRSLVDPNFRTQSKAAALDDRAQWFRDHPEAKMTDKLKREVFARNLNDWSFEDLHQLYTERKALEDIGREHLRAKKDAVAAEYADRRQRIIRAIYNDTGKLHAKMNATTDEEKRQAFAEKILEREIKRAQELTNPVTSESIESMKRKGKWTHLLTVSNLADYLDGGADWKGENHQLLHREVSDAVNKEAENVHRREVEMLDWIKSYNAGTSKENQIQLQNLSHFWKFDGYDRAIMGDALLDIYMKAKNDRAKEAITAVRGNNIRQSIIDHVNTVPELQWMRDLGDRIMQEYHENSDRLFDAMEEYDNVSPPREANYTPIIKEHGRTADGEEPGFMDDMSFDIGYANEYRRAAVNRSFSHARVDIPEEYQKPIQLAGYRTWLSQVRKQEKYINLKPVSKLLEAVYSDREVEEAILHTYGGGVLDEIRDYAKHVAGNPDRDLSAPAWLSNLLNHNANIAYLAYNFASTMKQFSTFPHILPYASPQRIMGATAAMMANPWTHVIGKANEKSVQFRTRMGSLDTLANDRASHWGKGKWTQTMGDIGTSGHVPLTVADKLVAGVAWDAVYNTELDKGTLPSEAVARADWVVGRTQHSNRVMDATGLNRSKSGFARIFAALTGPAFKLSNELTYAFGANIKNGHYVKATAQLTGLALGGLILNSVSNWAIPTAEDLAMNIAQSVSRWLPLFGDAIAAEVIPTLFGKPREFMNTPTSMVGSIIGDTEVLARGFGGLTQGQSEQARQTGIDNLVKAGLDGFGLATGFPSTIATRVYKAARTGDPMQILGAKATKK